jgi:hypothetical protein
MMLMPLIQTYKLEFCTNTPIQFHARVIKGHCSYAITKQTSTNDYGTYGGNAHHVHKK